MPRVIEVELLGPPRVLRDGAVVPFDTRKAVALLAHLAVIGRPRPRDSLADLLWPGTDLAHARGALRRTLSSVRSGVGADLVQATRDHVCLVRGPGLVVDVDVFRSLRESRPEDAVDLFRGDFMEGFVVRDAPAFEDWSRAEAEGLRQELVAVLALLTQRREGRGDRLGALGAARRWLAADPLHEPAHQALIRLYAEAGDRAASLTQYRECVRTLSRELGVPPLSETTQLYEAVNRGGHHGSTAPPPATRPAAPSKPSDRPVPSQPSAPSPGPPLVGRSAEMAELRGAYDSLGPGGGVVLVEGEAGIGKTRLVEDFLATLRMDGVQVLEARAFQEESGLAYGPVCDALRIRLRSGRDWLSGTDDRTLGEAARLLPELLEGSRPPDPLPGGPGAETRFLSAVWDTLVSAVAGRRPGVLFLDDGQWADDATIALLAFGLRRLNDRPVVLLMTARTPYEHALRRAARAAMLKGRGAVVHLERLSETAVAELLRATLGDDVPQEVAHQLWKRTEGVPLFVLEYLRTRDHSGEWPVPSGARELVRARLGPVTETARQTLSAAAVIGRSFDTDAVRLVSGRTEDETVTSLEELVEHGLLREGSVDYDFGHGLVRTLVYEETPLARRRLLHARAADLAGAPPAITARHLLLAGRDRDAAASFRVAGEHAEAVFANTDALSHFRAALAVGHPDRAGVQLQIGDLLTLSGDYSGAQSALEAAAADSRFDQLPEVEHRLGRLHHRRGDYALARAHLERALEGTPPGQLAGRASITADLSLAAQGAGDAELARSLATEAHVLAEEGPDLRALCQSYNLLGMLATLEGDIGESFSLLERSRALADQLSAPDLQVAALNNLALAHRANGGVSAALELTAAALELCTTTSADRHHEAALHNNLADLLHAIGRSDESMFHLKRSVEIFAEVGEGPEPRPGIWKLVRW
ncbi:MAG: AAA family ATPase [Ornithinibacter sp.]